MISTASSSNVVRSFEQRLARVALEALPRFEILQHRVGPGMP